MSEFLERLGKLSPQKLVLLIQQLQNRLETSEQAHREPIAVVGLGCRFPGDVDSPDSYWSLLTQGIDAISEIPSSRWDVDALYDPDPEAVGKVATRWGGFLKDVDQFDPAFFGISPREATAMDPQQRILLEVCWEALEDAGFAPDTLQGSPTGVFVGVCNADYHQLVTANDPRRIDAYLATGNAASVLSGRLSYVLGLQGPSVSVDTACSSSLVAFHLAVQSLRNKECRTAVAGGVNLILTPVTSMALSRSRMMAPDGRCKAFDESADGFVRSEGCGVAILKRLSDALADGDRIYAVVRGSAMNQDGRSNGLTAPNGPSQEAVLRAALANAGLPPSAMGYVETHGTGTSLGDPIEVQALGHVLGEGRPADRPVVLGSVKTNMGHMEAAAGIGGLIKAILMLHHREIAPHLHFKQPSSHIPWDELPVTVETRHVPWENGDRERIAGVSSFGFSGTNVHVVLGEAPPRVPTGETHERPRHLLALSADHEDVLAAMVDRFDAYLEVHPDLSLGDACYSANEGRARQKHRLAVAAEDRTELRAALRAWRAGEAPEAVLTGTVKQPLEARSIAFLFPGQGAQYPSMGAALYRTEPVFREVMDRCDALLRPLIDASILDVLFAEADRATLLHETRFTHPILFSFEYALANLWQAWGVRPGLLLGHSLGGYAAACLAGVFSLEDALRLVVARGEIMQRISDGSGKMGSLMATAEEVDAALAPYRGKVDIAAMNGPESVVISGDADGVEAVLADFEARGTKVRRLDVSFAGHSPHVDSVLDAFEAVAGEVTYHPPRIPIVSDLTGRMATPEEICSPTYWRRHVRETVRFAEGMAVLGEKGARAFVEIGPHSTLTGMGRLCLPDAGLAWIPSLRRNEDDWTTVLNAAGRLHTAGVPIDWKAFDAPYGRTRVPLPPYPWHRSRFWVSQRPVDVAPGAKGAGALAHPLLDRKVESPAVSGAVYEAAFNASWPSFVDHHQIFGLTILPSPAFVEMVLAAAELEGLSVQTMAPLVIQEALVLPVEGLRTVQVLLGEAMDDAVAFEVVSRGAGEQGWKKHVAGSLLLAAPAEIPPSIDLEAVRARCPEQIEGADYYAQVREMGLEFGEKFRGITRIWRGDGEAIGKVRLPETLLLEAGQYHMHPALLDACFHLLGAPLPRLEEPIPYLLISLDRLRFYRRPGATLWGHIVLTEGQDGRGETFVGDVLLYDESGEPVAAISGLSLKRVRKEALMRHLPNQGGDGWVYDPAWRKKAVPAGMENGVVATVALPLPAELETALGDAPGDAAARAELARFAELAPRLDALTVAYVAQALRILGWTPEAGAGFTPGALADSLGVVDRHRRLFGRLLDMLGEDGILGLHDGGGTVRTSLPEADPEDLFADLQAAFPAYGAELDLTAVCGRDLAGVLTGDADPMHLLFPEGSMRRVEPLYQHSPGARVHNALVRQAVEAAVAAFSADRPLRILEIGAGSGGTTAHVLPALKDIRVTYTYTDLSPHFLDKARDKFKAYPFIEYALLDIERSPASQGIDGPFDLILAANVLHATRDVREVVRHVRHVLAPGGLLMLLEGTTPLRWVDLTFGMMEGWWRFDDADLRPRHPLLSASQWGTLLEEEGFSAPAVVRRDAFEAHGQALLLTRAREAAPVTGTAAERWLVFADEGGVAEKAAARLREQGGACTLVYRGDRAKQVGSDRWTIDPASEAGFDRVFEAAAGAVPLRGILYGWGLDAPASVEPASVDPAGLDPNAAVASGPLVTVIRKQLAGTDTASRLWILTQGAQHVDGAGEAPVAFLQAPLHGIGRVMALEHPERWGAVIDLDPAATPARNAESVLRELSAGDEEDQVAYRSGERYVHRLEQGRPVAQAAPELRADGTYLVTGGLGGLGIELARWMAGRGAQHLVLSSRSGLPDRSTWASLPEDGESARRVRAVEALEASGVEVEVVAVDVADAEAMDALFGRFGSDLPPLRGIVHAALAMSAMPLRELDAETLAAMFRPKVTGAWNLHRLSRGLDLDFFVLFSSTTALWGVASMAHYAAANAFLDSLAHHRRQNGWPGLSINWGTWEEMRVATSDDQAEIARFGLRPMPTGSALELLGRLLATPGRAQAMVADVDWSRLKPAYEARRRRPFLETVGGSKPAGTGQQVRQKEKRPELRDRLGRTTTAAQRRTVLTGYVQDTVGRILGITDARGIDVKQGLFDMGMDSLMAVELKSRLEEGTGMPLPSTLTFNYSNVHDLAGFLETKFLEEAQVEEVKHEEIATIEDTTPAGGGSAPEQAGSEGDPSDMSEDELAALLEKKLANLL